MTIIHEKHIKVKYLFVLYNLHLCLFLNRKLIFYAIDLNNALCYNLSNKIYKIW